MTTSLYHAYPSDNYQALRFRLLCVGMRPPNHCHRADYIQPLLTALCGGALLYGRCFYSEVIDGSTRSWVLPMTITSPGLTTVASVRRVPLRSVPLRLFRSSSHHC